MPGWARALLIALLITPALSGVANSRSADALPAAVTTTLESSLREVWTTREGLPHNQVNAIAQTGEGYLWLGTWEGLVRYNGIEFEIYERRNTPQLKDNGIRSIQVADDGSLVVGTARGGVSILKHGVWRHIGPAQGLLQQNVLDAKMDKQGRLWVGTNGDGLVLIDQGRARRFDTRDGLPSLGLYSLMLSDDGDVWVPTLKGIARFGPDGRLKHTYASESAVFRMIETADGRIIAASERGLHELKGEHFERIYSELSMPVQSLMTTPDSAIWVGSGSRGLYRIAQGRIDGMTIAQGLPNDRVSSLFRDRSGNTWVGTNAGLARLRDAPFNMIGKQQGMGNDYVRTVLYTRDGQVLAGSGNGLHTISAGRVTHTLDRSSGLPDESILTSHQTRDGDIWLGTYMGGAVRLRAGRVVEHLVGERGFPATNQVRAIASDRHGTVWFGTTDGLVRKTADGTLQRFDQSTGLPHNAVISLLVTSDQRLWVGTLNGAARIENDQVKPVSLMTSGHRDIQSIFDIHEDPDGSIWFATDRGLAHWRQGRSEVAALAEGLPIDTLFQLIDDGLGYFWMTSNRGVLRVARAQVVAAMATGKGPIAHALYTEMDGLASAQCNGGSDQSAMLDKAGLLWVPTSRGLAVVDTRRIDQYSSSLPPVVIERVLADGEPLAIGTGTIELPAGTRRIEFYYSGLSYQNAQSLRYLQRLIGEDSDWLDRRNQRVVQYTNLKPGRYRFEVAPVLSGSSSDPAMAAVKSIEVILHPHFWQRRSFVVSACLLGFALMALAYRWRSRDLRRRAEQLESSVQSRTKVLHQQAVLLEQADADKTRLLDRLRDQAESLKRQASEDPLTGLFNRRHFENALVEWFKLAQQGQTSLCVVLFDIDHFKQINDRYSHSMGDLALREVANVLVNESRSGDVIARWGGEEFIVLLPAVKNDAARLYAERVRKAVEALAPADATPGLRLTLSGGVAMYQDEASADKLLEKADAKLYEAKRAGRNSIVA
ncbi:MAG: diguanylate cyclase [Pseudomonadota bacterium]|nr:diguanylate cyclase [Pseudomonadota bacterium]